MNSHRGEIAIIPRCRDDDEDMDATDELTYEEKESEVKSWLMEEIGRSDTFAFVKSSANLGMPVLLDPMPADRTFAMMKDSNVNFSRLRKINSHSLSYSGRRFTTSEGAMKETGDDAVEPIVESAEHEGKTYHYWLAKGSTDNNMLLCVKDAELNLIDDVNNLETVNLICGGDKRGDQFLTTGKLLLEDKDGKVLCEETYRLAEIPTKTDTAALLSKTPIGNLNTDLKRVITIDEKDGKLHV